MQKIIHKFVSLATQRSRLVLVAVVLGILLAGVLYSIYLGNELRYPDEREYVKIASNLVANRGYSLDGTTPTIFWPPGYPLFLAIFMALGANVIFLRILNFIALGLSMIGVYRMLQREASGGVAVLGVFLVMGYPVLFYTAGTLFPQTLTAVLLLAVIYLLSAKAPSKWQAGLAGILLGALILVAPAYAFALVILGLWYGFTHRPWKHLLISLSIPALLVAGWCFRNYQVSGTFVFISANSGLNLLLGNSENTTPNAGVTVDISKYKAATEGMTEADQDAYYRTQALAYMSRHPVQTVQRYWAKFFNYFNYRNQLETSSESSSLKDLLMLITYGPLLMLLLVRLLLLKQFRPTQFEILLLAIYLGSALFHALFFTRIRFRLPFDYLLIMVAALFLGQLWVRQIFRATGEPKIRERTRNTREM